MCVQDAGVEQTLRRGGLLVAGLIGPDTLVIAVHVGRHESTIVVTVHHVLAADAGDGA